MTHDAWPAGNPAGEVVQQPKPKPAMAMPPRPPIDPELKAGLQIVGGVFPPTITEDLIGFMRKSYASPPVSETLDGKSVVHEEYELSGYRGDTIPVSVFRPERASGRRPVILYAHSGGLMFGDRFSALHANLEWVESTGALLICPEYRLAPEYSDPYAREDFYAALEWTVQRAEVLGADRRRIVVAGASSGGALAAGLALASRDRGGPQLHGQMLIYPMLDDRGHSASVQQFDGVGVWDRISNATGWASMLGEDHAESEEVSSYIAPARATDLTGLPPAYLDVGSVEIFRDETIDYANRIWRSGGTADLHVWAGAFHACDVFAPHTAIAQQMIRTRNQWVATLLAD